ncbi:hypothetical protein I6N95_16435 [Vagococcus sp. BWB3-3]|uniref:Resolvase/invertase-type recombinase catalytic domain-containing protein n=1 Tax=Vagococcus allomyrinae TaxID=2794353 RepID=A0A940P7Q5_9ENTE|nr:recombinase family protein [Vagococcus allomyrinae]MBP1042605.1 hypothetical protein [Vagococcus allomyrinae]
MKIGFIRNAGKASQMASFCDIVMLETKTTPIAEQLLTLVNDHSQQEIIFYSIEDLRMQIVQLLPFLTKVIEHETKVSFVERQLLPTLDDDTFIKSLFDIAVLEKAVLSRRTQEAVSTARRNGKAIGRPTIDQSIVKQIYFLYNKQGRSIREVAALCEVSIGTVHKYLMMEKEAK